MRDGKNKVGHKQGQAEIRSGKNKVGQKQVRAKQGRKYKVGKKGMVKTRSEKQGGLKTMSAKTR